jgi:hypothetical protein
MIRLVPVYRYQQNAEQGELLTAFRNWLHTLKIIVFLILTIVFIFSIGAGWGINQCSKSHAEIKPPVKIVKHKRHR